MPSSHRSAGVEPRSCRKRPCSVRRDVCRSQAGSRPWVARSVARSNVDSQADSRASNLCVPLPGDAAIARLSTTTTGLRYPVARSNSLRQLVVLHDSYSTRPGIRPRKSDWKALVALRTREFVGDGGLCIGYSRGPYTKLHPACRLENVIPIPAAGSSIRYSNCSNIRR